jgi:ketosteroid isomerase-like protein
MTTADTLSHHLQAILAVDVDAIMEDYTEQSVLVTQNGTIMGVAGIRMFFEQFIANSPPALLQSITLTYQEVVGDVAFIVWQAVPFIPFATDTFVIRDGKIAVQTFAMVAGG